MTFEVKKDKLYSILFYVLFLIFGLVLVTILRSKSSGHSLPFIVAFSIIILMVWVWYTTEYRINSMVLSVRFGPFKRNIPIKSISKIDLNQTVWVGNNFGLSTGGLIVHYGKANLIYITPKKSSKFCEELKLVNKNIQFTKN